MTVEELIEELRTMPPTAVVWVMVPESERTDWYELVDTAIETVTYSRGQVSVRLMES